MKKFSTYLASALLTLVVFTSCSSDPAKVDVTKLEEPCDFVDAAEAILDEMIEMIESVDGDRSKLSEADLERGQALAEKLNELEGAKREKFDDDKVFEDCPNAKAVQKKLREVR